VLPDWDVPHGKTISAISANSSVNFQGWLIIPDHAELFPEIPYTASVAGTND
jgi:hypothetical protein